MTFAVVMVRSGVVDGPSDEVESVRESFGELFPGMPVVLMAEDRKGRPTFNGRRDIARFLSTLRTGAIDWIDYRVSAEGPSA